MGAKDVEVEVAQITTHGPTHGRLEEQVVVDLNVVQCSSILCGVALYSTLACC